MRLVRNAVTRLQLLSANDCQFAVRMAGDYGTESLARTNNRDGRVAPGIAPWRSHRSGSEGGETETNRSSLPLSPLRGRPRERGLQDSSGQLSFMLETASLLFYRHKCDLGWGKVTRIA